MLPLLHIPVHVNVTRGSKLGFLGVPLWMNPGNGVSAVHTPSPVLPSYATAFYFTYGVFTARLTSWIGRQISSAHMTGEARHTMKE